MLVTTKNMQSVTPSKSKTPGLSEESDVVLSQRSIDRRNWCATLTARRRSDECLVRGQPIHEPTPVRGDPRTAGLLGPEEARGLSDEVVVHRVMCRALEYQAELSTLKSKEPPRPEPPHRYGQQ